MRRSRVARSGLVSAKDAFLLATRSSAGEESISFETQDRLEDGGIKTP
jgi:hypothetical protein